MRKTRKPAVGVRPVTLAISEWATLPAWFPRLGPLLVRWKGASIHIPGGYT